MVFLVILVLLAFALFYSIYWYHLREVANLTAEKSLLRATSYYAGPERFYQRDFVNPEEIKNSLRAFRFRKSGERIWPGDWAILNPDECLAFIQSSAAFKDSERDDLDEELGSCLVLGFKKNWPFAFFKEQLQVALLTGENKLLASFITEPGVFGAENLKPAAFFTLPPEKLLDYFSGNPVWQVPLTLSEIPSSCLNATLAIEDSEFLKHQGISFTGIARALIKNLQFGRAAQGGSTITQQLVKNYFLTPEKTLKRKLREFFMALAIEKLLTKDEILETYLNIIYLGQEGALEVRGLGAASEYYFNKPAKNLSLGECSLLAALINSPGRYHPVRNPDAAKTRKALVLARMKELQLTTENLIQAAALEPLPKKTKKLSGSTTPFYIEAVKAELVTFDKEDEAFSGLHVITHLDLKLQRAAEEAIKRQLNNLDAKWGNKKKVSYLKAQAAFVGVDVKGARVRALIGGQAFQKTQFNRALHAKRQMGSLIKPFLFLKALSENPHLHALYPILDHRLVVQYENQVWRPKNYNQKEAGLVPLFFALKNSLNLAAVHLSLSSLYGEKNTSEAFISLAKELEQKEAKLSPQRDHLNNLHKTLLQLGLKTPEPLVPAFLLGSIEISPLELVQAYLLFASGGKEHAGLAFLNSVYLQNGDLKELGQLMSWQSLAIKEYETGRTQAAHESRFPVEKIYEVVSFLQNTLSSGTAKSLKDEESLKFAAGKTGTTSDYKDSWFVGFTPLHLGLSWVGFDDNASLGLASSEVTLPIWRDYMLEVQRTQEVRNFSWPVESSMRTIRRNDLLDLGFQIPETESFTEAEILFND